MIGHIVQSTNDGIGFVFYDSSIIPASIEHSVFYLLTQRIYLSLWRSFYVVLIDWITCIVDVRSRTERTTNENQLNIWPLPINNAVRWHGSNVSKGPAKKVKLLTPSQQFQPFLNSLFRFWTCLQSVNWFEHQNIHINIRSSVYKYSDVYQRSSTNTFQRTAGRL